MPLRPALAVLIALGLGALQGCAPRPAERVAQASVEGARPALPAAEASRVEAAVQAVLASQVEAWNAGSVRGFMDGYAATDAMTFLSGGSVRQGWQAALAAYERGYPTPEAMGTLAFEGLVVRPLSARHALVWGRWRLAYPEGGRPEASGLFTLLVEDTPQGWRVVHDHTSSAG